MTARGGRPWQGAAGVTWDDDSTSVVRPADTMSGQEFGRAIAAANVRIERLAARWMAVHARAYAEAGIRVFPLGRDKRPKLAKSQDCRARSCRGCEKFGHGFYDASSDPDRVEAMWRIAGADSGIGCRPPDSVVVLDTDPRNGGDVWLGTAPVLPSTLTVWSGRGDGGRHLYYQAPDGVLRAGLLRRSGVDLKTSSGYVVLPPTRHPVTGEPYRWDLPLHEVAAMSPWLIDQVCGSLMPPMARATPPAVRGGASHRARVHRTGWRGLLRWVRQSPCGERNARLFWAAKRFAEVLERHGYEAEFWVGELIREGVRTGLSETAVRATVDSALRRDR